LRNKAIRQRLSVGVRVEIDSFRIKRGMRRGGKLHPALEVPFGTSSDRRFFFSRLFDNGQSPIGEGVTQAQTFEGEATVFFRLCRNVSRAYHPAVFFFIWGARLLRPFRVAADVFRAVRGVGRESAVT